MKEQTTQQRILDAAIELMYAQSYAEVGIAAICEKAGVQKGSFYHFFKSKQDLAMAVLEENFAEFKGAILDSVRQLLASDSHSSLRVPLPTGSYVRHRLVFKHLVDLNLIIHRENESGF